jgi:hypothetical protein
MMLARLRATLATLAEIGRAPMIWIGAFNCGI